MKNKQIFTTLQKRLMVVSVTMMSSVYVWAACNAVAVKQPPSVVDTPRLTAEKGIKKALELYDVKLSKSLQTHEAAIISSLAILTKQKEITADYVSVSDDKSSQVLATVIGETERMNAIKDVIETNSQHGQGHDPCAVLAEQKEAAQTAATADSSIYGTVRTEITAAPGKYTPRDQVIAERTVIHDANYCTADQAASGLCRRPGPRAGKSLRASTLLSPSTYGDTSHEDKIAFINNFIGFPAQPLGTSEVGTVSGVSYIENTHRLNALRSPAMAALKMLQAEYTATDEQLHYLDSEPSTTTAPTDAKDNSKEPEGAETKDKDGKVVTKDAKDIKGTNEKNQAAKAEIAQTKATEAEREKGDAGTAPADTATASKRELDKDKLPMVLQLEKQVGRYLGNGEEYKKWNETLISQNEKGLLTEVLKIKSFTLFLKAREHQQLMALESMLAATVAADLRRSGMESKVKEARSDATNNQIAALISRQNQ